MQALHAARMSLDPCSMLPESNTSTFQVQQLMEIAPDCPELPDLLCTIRQVACAKLSLQTIKLLLLQHIRRACLTSASGVRLYAPT